MHMQNFQFQKPYPLTLTLRRQPEPPTTLRKPPLPKTNKITQVSGATTPTYHGKSNLPTHENNYRFVYEAWNKVVQVKDSSNGVLVTYSRGALHCHLTDTVGSTVTDRFFSNDWRLLGVIHAHHSRATTAVKAY